jgi:hypothetical protein
MARGCGRCGSDQGEGDFGARATSRIQPWRRARPALAASCPRARRRATSPTPPGALLPAAAAINPTPPLPSHPRADNTRAATRNSYGLRFKLDAANPVTAPATAPAPAPSAGHAATSAAAGTAAAPGKAAAMPPPAAAVAASRASAAAPVAAPGTPPPPAAGAGGAGDSSAAGGGVPQWRPVKAVAEFTDVTPPAEVDDDLLDKSVAVQAAVSARSSGRRWGGGGGGTGGRGATH